jgi:hypothetical protein
MVEDCQAVALDCLGVLAVALEAVFAEDGLGLVGQFAWAALLARGGGGAGQEAEQGEADSTHGQGPHEASLPIVKPRGAEVKRLRWNPP